MLRLIFLAAIAAPRGPGAALQESPPVARARPWPHQVCDLPVRPGARFAALDNGLRVAWRRTGRSEPRVRVWVHVAAGALMEPPGQEGLAHLLEHVLFRGSERWPDGEVDRWARRNGLGSGPDLNAFTDWGETIFLLDVPSEPRSLLGEGLSRLADLLRAPLLEESALASELAIVAAEQRERAQPVDVLEDELERAAWSGLACAAHDVLGTSSSRALLARDDLARFHRAWYRPSRTTVVLAGDLPADPLALVRELFGGWSEPAAPAPELATLVGAFDPSPRTVVRSVPGLGEQDLELSWTRGAEPLPRDAREGLVRDLGRDVATTVLSRRLEALAGERGELLLDAWATRAPPTPVAPVERLALRLVLAPGADVVEVIGLARREVAGLLEHLPAEHELASARARHLAALADEVAAEAELDLVEEADRLLSMAAGEGVDYPLRAVHAALEEGLRALDRERLAAWARELLAGEPTLAWAGEGVAPERAAGLRAAWDAAAPSGDPPRPWPAPPPFAYACDPLARGAERRRAPGGDGAWIEVEYENGVRLLHSPDPGARVEVRVHLLGGRRSLRPEQWPYAWIAESVFLDQGLVAHDALELARVLEARDVSRELWVEDDAILLGGACARRDLLAQCELLRATLAHPGWDPRPWDALRRGFAAGYQAYLGDADATLGALFWPALFGSEHLAWVPGPEDLARTELASWRAWLEGELSGAPLAVTVWGGEREQVAACVAATFGTLPERRALSPRAAPERLAVQPGLAAEYRTGGVGEAASVVLVVPNPGCGRTVGAWSAKLLASALQVRLEARFRDELGWSYGAEAWAYASPAFEDLAYIQAVVPVADEHAQEARRIALEVVDALGREGIAEPELDSLAAQARSLYEGTYWLEVLSAQAREPRAWADWLAEGRFYQRVGAQRLARLARRVLRRDQVSTAILRPRS